MNQRTREPDQTCVVLVSKVKMFSALAVECLCKKRIFLKITGAFEFTILY